ncbi:intraflagellar transport protein 57 homolog [Lytechinus pictus]|uniref:intraflagellar transport protein 57 homolog n=1 Tax=Lytechinus pictus TaxID=7653 RepID=UPI00240E98F4|nr:intraflagellar transport protein 57 homolog [Lytechinus pictus]XP_054760136.1 intraflagellar transport protein 57 homolog [Lytechinus pictus]
MGEEKGRDDSSEIGPGQMYQHYIIMEDLLDKLKLLSYEEEFLKELGFKPLSRHYFAIATNPGEQFYMFTSLSAWLISLSGKQFDRPQEYDDPNATIANILGEVRQLGAATDFPPNKLKTGHGEYCIYVLDKLADEALKKSGFKWGKPLYPEEETEEESTVDDDVELTLDKVDDEIAEEEDVDEDESFLDLEGLRNLQTNKETAESSRPEEIMESSVDANEWRLEVERVTPSLKVHIRTDNKDWRTHVDQMHQHKDGIETALSETKGYLDKLHKEITRTLEKIGSREKYINNQLEHLLQDFRGTQDGLAEVKEQYRQASGGVTDRTRQLAEVTEELERIKQEMEERGSSMTDGSPLVKIKQALQRLKNEVIQMDVRVGVVEQNLLQAKLKDKTNMQRDMNKPIGNGNDYDY